MIYVAVVPSVQIVFIISHRKEIVMSELDILCEILHDAYEKASLETGWQTQEVSRVSWADLPEANKATMRIAIRTLLTEYQAKTLEAVKGLEKYLEYQEIDGGGIISATEGEKIEDSTDNNLGVGFGLLRDEEYLKLSEVIQAIKEVEK